MIEPGHIGRVKSQRSLRTYKGQEAVESYDNTEHVKIEEALRRSMKEKTIH